MLESALALSERQDHVATATDVERVLAEFPTISIDQAQTVRNIAISQTFDWPRHNYG